MELKYVITDKNCFAIFSTTAEHRDVATGLWGKPMGAGFCTIAEGNVRHCNVHCYGKSVSLNLSARPEDEEIINHKINSSY